MFAFAAVAIRRLTALQHLLVLLTRNIFFPFLLESRIQATHLRVIKSSPLFSLCCWVNNCASLFTCLSTECFGHLDLISPNGCIRVAVYKKTPAYWPTIWKIRLYLCHVFFFLCLRVCVCHILLFTSQTRLLDCVLVLRLRSALALLFCPELSFKSRA